MTPNPLKDLLRRAIIDNGGFLSDLDISELTKLDRLRPVLVRCGCGRFQCPAQDANHFASIINEEGRDYVRDVSLLAGDRAYCGDYTQFTNDPPPAPPRRPATPAVSHAVAGSYAPAYSSYDYSPSDADPGL